MLCKDCMHLDKCDWLLSRDGEETKCNWTPSRYEELNLRFMVKAWLETYGYDGLYSYDCGCICKDLMPCGEPHDSCQPGYRRKDPDGEFDFLVGPKKDPEGDQ